jgi:AraC-like DNA-binding protein
MKTRSFYQTLAQFRDFDKSFPIHRLDWAVPDTPASYLHYHNGLELGLCRSGPGVFIVADKVRPFRTGDISVIDRSERHYAQSAPGVNSDWTWAQMDVIGLLAPFCRDLSLVDPTPLAGPGFPNVFSPVDHPTLCALVERFFDELRGTRPFREIRVRALVLEIMVELRRMKFAGAGPARPHSPAAAERIAPALEHVALNYPHEVRVDHLARLCALGPTRFRHLFAVETGKSPQRYLAEVRVGMACAMLRESSRPIGRIAAECGYATLSTFNRAFHAVTGVSPREWRTGV